MKLIFAPLIDNGKRMRKYKITDAIFLSFYSKDLYLDILKNWRGLGFAYLLVVITVFSLGEFVQLQRFVTDWVSTRGPGVVVQVPDIWFTDGKLHHNGSENPLIINDPVTYTTVAILDTTMTSFVLPDSNFVAVIGREKLLINNGIQLQMFDLRQFEHLILDAEVVDYWFSFVGNWFVILIAPFLILQTFILQILITAFMALIAWVYLRYYVKYIPFSVMFRLAVIASTPMLLWQSLCGIFPDLLGSLQFLTALIGVAYVYYAALVVKNEAIIINKKIKNK